MYHDNLLPYSSTRELGLATALGLAAFGAGMNNDQFKKDAGKLYRGAQQGLQKGWGAVAEHTQRGWDDAVRGVQGGATEIGKAVGWDKLVRPYTTPASTDPRSMRQRPPNPSAKKDPRPMRKQPPKDAAPAHSRFTRQVSPEALPKRNSTRANPYYFYFAY